MLINATSTVDNTQQPAAGSSTESQKFSQDFDKFLKLLVTQLQHQDPLEPVDAKEFTAQLVQFASVEQEIHQSDYLQEIIRMQENQAFSDMAQNVGRTVEVAGNRFPLVDQQARFSYTLPAVAEHTDILIRDGDGRTVYRAAGETGAERHEFAWDGRSQNGEPLPDGIYTLQIQSATRDGTAIDAKTSVYGLVDGAVMTADGPRLLLGQLPVRMEELIAIRRSDPV
jgi:flagellar basal-body rod modification protein FlgD